MENTIDIKKTAVKLMILTIILKAFGLVREVYFSSVYGTSSIADAYLFSLTIATIIYGFIGNGLTTSYIPMYQKVVKSEGCDKGIEFTRNVCVFYVLVSLIVIGVLYYNVDCMVDVFAYGFSADTKVLAAYFCKYSILTIIFTGLFGIYRGFLQTQNCFEPPASVGILLNIIMCIFIYISQQYGNVYLGVGNVLAVASQSLILLPFLTKYRYWRRIKFSFKNSYLINLIKVSLPMMVSISANQINVLINKALASEVEGGISALNYAHTIITIINDIAINAIISAIYPKISKYFAERDIKEANKTFADTYRFILFLLVPCAIGMMVCSKEIIQVIYGRGAFTQESVDICAGILQLYAIGIPFVGLRQMLVRTFYAMQDTKTPVVNTTVAIAINIVLSMLLKGRLGISGLALSNSLSSVISAVLLSRSYYKGNHEVKNMMDKKDILKIITAAGMMGVVCFSIRNFLLDRGEINASLVRLLLIVVTGVVFYALFSIAFKEKEILGLIRRNR